MNTNGKLKSTIAVILIIANLLGMIVGTVPIQIQAAEGKQQKNILNITLKESGGIECSLEMEFGQKTTSAGKINSYVKGETYYLLLPSQLELSSTEILVEAKDGVENLWDGQPIDGVTQLTLSEEEHTLTVDGTAYTIVLMQSKDMAAMFINTEELDKIHADKEYKTNGTMTLLTAGGSIEYDGDLSQLKTRGNSTFYNDKKSYQIKLSNSTDLLGLGKAKTWILLANANDPSSMRHKIVYNLAMEAGLQNSVSGDWIDFYINGDYNGTYLLSEKVEVGENRVDIVDLKEATEEANQGINLEMLPSFGTNQGTALEKKGVIIPKDPSDITGGYILELEAMNRYEQEISGFVTKNKQPVVIKSPEYASIAQTEYIANLVQQFEDAIFSEDGKNPETNKHYSEYFDMDSFVKRYIIDEVSRNVDAGVTSCFFYKQAGDDELIYSGPCWDYDTSLGRNWGIASSTTGLGYHEFTEENTANWYEELYKFTSFRNQIRRIYNETFRPLLKDMVETKIPKYMEHLSASLAMNEIRWPDEEYGMTYEEDQKKVCSFLQERVAWLNGVWTNELEEEGKIVYVKGGEGAEGIGKGTETSPYLNIRTALAQIDDGDTLKLIGNVKYTKYEAHTDGSAKPFFINKKITIEGDGDSTSLMTRSTIQLGADVTFRNMNLQMIPETLLGRMLGEQAERSTTIFTAGHSLTLDRVNTKMSTSPAQYLVRPYISAGRYKGIGKLGDKAVVRIINPVEETKISAIYAGDYWYDTQMDVELYLDGKLLDTTLYAGGVDGKLRGNIHINLYGKSNLSGINKANYEGTIKVRLMQDYFTDSLSIDGVNEVVLENGARITVPSTGTFQAEKVTLKNKAVLDFRHMLTNPSITGDFIGIGNVADVQQAGAVILNNKQLLSIGGAVQGITRLNSNGVESIPYFEAGHVYISAASTSKGDFSIAGTTHTGFEIQKSTELNQTVWKVCRKQVDEGDKFQYFRWAGGPEQIIKPSLYQEFIYPIHFYNNNNVTYKPGRLELLREFEYDLVREDGVAIDLDDDIFVDWDYENEDEDGLAQIKLTIYNLDKAYGKLILTVKHPETKKQIQKVINIYSEEPSEKPEEGQSPQPEVTPSENPEIGQNPQPGGTPSENPGIGQNPQPGGIPSEKPLVSPTPTPTPIVKPSIKLSRTNVTLYTTDSTVLQLRATVVGTSKNVTYTSNNTKVAKVDKNGKVIAVGQGQAVITAEANGVKAYCKVAVKKTSLKLNVSKTTMYTAGKTVLYLQPAIVGPSNKVTYRSSDSKIARVDKNGRVTVVKPGTVNIIVKANGITKKCHITVKKPTVSVKKSSVTVKRKKKATIEVNATPNGKVTFVSADKKIATVTKRGVITGVRTGTTTITVKCNGITKKVAVKVIK